MTHTQYLFTHYPVTGNRKRITVEKTVGMLMYIVSIDFDDGMKKSCEKIASIFEKYGLAATFNVIATGHHRNYQPFDKYHLDHKGDFRFWNEMVDRGHEVMPHGYRHSNKSFLPFSKACDLIRRCLDIFSENLKGFDPARTVFSFPFNSSNRELEQWLPRKIRAFRTGGDGINPLPYPGQVKLLSGLSGNPKSCEDDLDGELARLFSAPEGWLIYAAHGLDDEGWAPMGSRYLDELLDRLTSMDSVKVLPTCKALGTES